MLKVMIVDDEFIVRVGFKSSVEWEKYGCQVIAACGSGKEAIEIFSKELPDIVFTDIMMPEMDGIELVEYTKTRYPWIRVVVLSCLNEIDYVKKAIRLGAEDYILKLSFTQESIVELIQKLSKSIEEERKEQSIRQTEVQLSAFNREEGMRLLLAEKLSVCEKESLLDRLGYPYDPFVCYGAACLLIDKAWAAQSEENDNGYMKRYSLLNLVREYFAKLPQNEAFFVGDRQMIVLFKFNRGEGIDDVKHYFPDLLRLLNEALSTHMNTTVSMGLGEEIENRVELPSLYQQAVKAANLRFFDGTASFHMSDENRNAVWNKDIVLMKQMQEAVLRHDKEKAFELTETFFESIKGISSTELIQKIRHTVMEIWLFVSGVVVTEESRGTESLKMIQTDGFYSADTVKELKDLFETALDSLFGYLQNRKTVDPQISRLLDWLEVHVDQTISLEEAAGRCALGKSQFCSLFKKATGETFVNYVNRLKMRKALILLENGSLQVQEVAMKIGVSDLSYFSRLFKRYHGISPSDVWKK